MTKKCRTKAVLASAGFALILCGALPAQAADAAKPNASSMTTMAKMTTPVKEEWMIPNGEHWLKATEVEKQAYVLGILNMAMIEYQMSGNDPKHRTAVPRLIQGLNGMTVSQIVGAVNKYYSANPDKLKQTVIEGIWLQVAKPNLDQAKVK